MRTTITLLSALIAFGVAGHARADEPVKLKLQIEPVSDPGQLHELMRQNTVRVALQRYRLWQEAAAREQLREQLREQRNESGEAQTSSGDQTQAAEAKTHRRHRATPPAPEPRHTPEPSPSASAPATREGGAKTPPPATNPPGPARENTATRERLRGPGSPGSSQPVGPRAERDQLRNILREQRSDEDLAAKLRERTRDREQQRRDNQAEEKRQQKKGQGSSGKHGSGGGGGH